MVNWLQWFWCKLCESIPFWFWFFISILQSLWNKKTEKEKKVRTWPRQWNEISCIRSIAFKYMSVNQVLMGINSWLNFISDKIIDTFSESVESLSKLFGAITATSFSNLTLYWPPVMGNHVIAIMWYIISDISVFSNHVWVHVI